MADPYRHQQHHFQTHHPRGGGGVKNLLPGKGGGPSATQLLTIVTLLPVGGTLLGLAGITLIGTLIGLAVATPVFIIFSPILVPAVILLTGAVTAFLTSGAFGLTGLSSLSWVFNSFRRVTGGEPLEYAKRRVQDATAAVGEKTRQAGEMVGEKTKQTGEAIKGRAQEGGRESGGAGVARAQIGL
ncbi:hypothetical protein BUALT_Bualt16G0015600 [Buddleja alternifolia]|uniref:Oleosin n=1 Tax=Buddleja alternifolia TaxID=168488 RepID=A0AAV6W5Y0_9LAMI|nr:hypothetical protein BUALT_Bualt16G0015600 [Buddleja alternifolia]